MMAFRRRSILIHILHFLVNQLLNQRIHRESKLSWLPSIHPLHHLPWHDMIKEWEMCFGWTRWWNSQLYLNAPQVFRDEFFINDILHIRLSRTIPYAFFHRFSTNGCNFPDGIFLACTLINITGFYHLFSSLGFLFFSSFSSSSSLFLNLLPLLHPQMFSNHSLIRANQSFLSISVSPSIPPRLFFLNFRFFLHLPPLFP